VFGRKVEPEVKDAETLAAVAEEGEHRLREASLPEAEVS
jgi:hypothetical protein